jgi:hypothetical protein
MQHLIVALVTIFTLTGVSFSQPATAHHRNPARQDPEFKPTCNIQRGVSDSWKIAIPEAPPAAGVNKCEPFTQGIQTACKDWKILTCDYDDKDRAWSIGLRTERESCQEVDVEGTLGSLECVVEMINPEDEDENLGFGEGVLLRV